MLFPGVVFTSDRVTAEIAGVIAVINGGFGFTAASEIVLEVVAAPQVFIKGVGCRNTGAVCATTTTDVSDIYIEGVRVTTAGKLVYADAAPANTTSGNPVTATGALAVLL